MTKIDEINKPKQQEFPTISEVYVQSIIDWETYIDEIVLVSVKTANNIETLERLEFFKFRFLTKGLKRYIEAENKQNGDSTEADKVKDSASDMMSKAKSSMKMPKLSVPKLK